MTSIYIFETLKLGMAVGKTKAGILDKLVRSKIIRRDR